VRPPTEEVVDELPPRSAVVAELPPCAELVPPDAVRPPVAVDEVVAVPPTELLVLLLVPPFDVLVLDEPPLGEVPPDACAVDEWLLPPAGDDDVVLELLEAPPRSAFVIPPLGVEIGEVTASSTQATASSAIALSGSHIDVVGTIRSFIGAPRGIEGKGYRIADARLAHTIGRSVDY
jgi:hypothetical protein